MSRVDFERRRGAGKWWGRPDFGNAICEVGIGPRLSPTLAGKCTLQGTVGIIRIMQEGAGISNGAKIPYTVLTNELTKQRRLERP